MIKFIKFVIDLFKENRQNKELIDNIKKNERNANNSPGNRL